MFSFIKTSRFGNAAQLFAILMVLMFVGSMKAVTPAEKLAGRVRASIANYYSEPFTITADTQGKVTIKGTVNTMYDRLDIFDLISKVPGVREISDQLAVNTSTLPDDAVKANIEDEINLIQAIQEPDKINVSVDNGVVMLDGTVSFYREKQMAETAASWQEGVKSIVNNISVLPPNIAQSDQNLETVLKGVLSHNFPLEKGASFQVKNGVVTLTGSVGSLWAKKSIRKEFLKVLGVKDVVNQLTVSVQNS